MEIIHFINISLKKLLIDLNGLLFKISKEHNTNENNMKNNFINAICNLVEMFHFFKMNLSRKAFPYNVNFWSRDKDMLGYFKLKIFKCCECLENIKVCMIY
jgi:hypothetical protein